jgi:hypothetical protein
MALTNQHDSPAFCPRQENPERPRTRPLSHRQILRATDVTVEAYLSHGGYVPARETSGFWRSCWTGFVALNSQGRHEFLAERRLRRAMRRLIERGTFGSLIDLGEQHRREALDRKIRLDEKRAERSERRQWEMMR